MSKTSGLCQNCLPAAVLQVLPVRQKYSIVFCDLAGSNRENMTRILVVDDSSLNVTLLTGMLTCQGYAASSALSGQQALEMIAVERPDGILPAGEEGRT
jgi:hypothetical protein